MEQSNISKERFKEMVDTTSPNSKVLANCAKAFLSGGLICALGQIIYDFVAAAGFTKDESSMIVSIALIFIAAIATGVGIYDKFGKFAGAGSIVPITGFANAITSPAVEFKREGFIFGVGAKMFAIAGPVIVYGVLSSVAVGIIYYFIGKVV